ncbi:MAG: bactofilin family protein [Stellaceae bacterium]
MASTGIELETNERRSSRDAFHVTRTPEIPPVRQLLVGEDIHIVASIDACDVLSIAGHVEATLSGCKRLQIFKPGTFVGSARVEVAEISGAFKGKLTAVKLLVRATGKVSGDISYEQIELERGGEISGNAVASASRSQFINSEHFNEAMLAHAKRATLAAVGAEPAANKPGGDAD